MHPFLNHAIKAARLAGCEIVRYADEISFASAKSKGVHDFVTEVDKIAEQLIIDTIKTAYPSHQIISEECGKCGGESSNIQWIIDPLDGTTNFIHQIPHYAISIAVVIKGRLSHAVVLDPIKQEEFTASRGEGARLNNKRIRCSNLRVLDDALLATGFPFRAEQKEIIIPYFEMAKEFANRCSGIRRAGAASLDLAYLAAGRHDGFWEFGLKNWDIAAGALLVQEAGGLISDFNGGADFLKSGNVVCATPKLFKPLLQIVNKHLKTY